MNRYAAGMISKHGVDLEIFVDDFGRWSATYAGKFIQSSTRDGLEAQVGKTVKAAVVKVAIPFTAMKRNGNRVRRGVATGIHSANGNVLARWDSGEAEQFSYGNGYETMGDLTPDEATEWVNLTAAYERTMAALRNFKRVHEINLASAVRDAVDKLAETADKEASS